MFSLLSDVALAVLSDFDPVADETDGAVFSFTGSVYADSERTVVPGYYTYVMTHVVRNMWGREDQWLGETKPAVAAPWNAYLGEGYNEENIQPLVLLISPSVGSLGGFLQWTGEWPVADYSAVELFMKVSAASSWNIVVNEEIIHTFTVSQTTAGCVESAVIPVAVGQATTVRLMLAEVPSVPLTVEVGRFSLRLDLRVPPKPVLK